MKKVYLKPDADFISLESEELITNIIDGEVSSGDEIPDDWE